MNPREYQLACDRTWPEQTPRDALGNVGLGLTGEAGEVADLLKKHLHHGHALNSDKIAEEVGDVLYYVATICNVLGLDMGAVMRANVEKLRARYPEGFDPARSKRRDVCRCVYPEACACPQEWKRARADWPFRERGSDGDL